MSRPASRQYADRHSGAHEIHPAAGKTACRHRRRGDDCPGLAPGRASRRPARSSSLRPRRRSLLQCAPQAATPCSPIPICCPAPTGWRKPWACAIPQRRFGFIVNLQGDLPMLDPAAIAACLAPLADPNIDIATLASEIRDAEEAHNPNVVKAIADLGPDRPVAMATDFCRDIDSADDAPHWHHIGIYAFRRTALERFVLLAPSERERPGASNRCAPSMPA
jgi:hypothetical protein